MRVKSRVSDNPLINAVLKSGVYDLDLRSNIVDQSENFLRCYGSIAGGLAGDQSITIRIHDNCFAHLDNVDNVRIGLKLKAGLRHSNAGGYAYQEKWYNFFHKAMSISAITAPLEPIWSSLAQAITNESLDMQVTSVSQVGRTEAGASQDFYVDVVISLTSERTSPVYGLNYELELQLF